MHTADRFAPATVPTFDDPEVARVWNYWFAHRLDTASREPAADPYAEGYAMNHALWFHGGADVDADLRARFEGLVARAARGELDGWDATVRGRLARVIVLDQFPRNIDRGTAKAFAHDATALALAREALARGDDRQLSPAEAMFLYTALTHSEDAADVRRAVEGLGVLITRCTHRQQKSAKAWRVSALKHLHLLERFGRYPHRNAALGRESTPTEEAFLAHPEFSAVFMRSQHPDAATKPARTPAVTAPTPARPPIARKLRVLALHGFRQNGSVFRSRTVKMRRALEDLVDFTFVTSPMRYTPKGDTRDATLAAFGELPDYPMQQVWWLSSEDNATYEGFHESVAFLETVFRTQGPFDGVVGFAQGGTLAAVLAAMQHPVIRFRFAVCISSFPSRAAAHRDFVAPGTVGLPSLHVLGEHDILVTPDRSERLFEAFDARTSVLVRHGGGHFVPSAWPYDAMRAFVSPFVDDRPAPEPTPDAESAPPDNLFALCCEGVAATPVDVAVLETVLDEMAGQHRWRELVEVALRAHARRTPDDVAQPEASGLVAVHDGIVDRFARQLALDLREGAFPSPCGAAAPRVGSHADKVCRLARDIARALFPLDDMAAEIAALARAHASEPPQQEPARADRRKTPQSLDATKQARNLSYQRYGQTLSRLRGALREADPRRADAQLQRMRRAKALTPEVLLQQGDDGLSRHVTEPEPEPVVPCTREDLEPLLAYLRSNVEVESQTAFCKGTMTPDGRLDLCKQVVGPEGIAPLLGAMMRTDRVKRLLLGNNIVGDGGAEAIARFIRERRDSPLDGWYIAGNHIGPAGLAHVCDALAHDAKVTSLWLKRNPLKAAGMVPLARLLRTNRAIEVLDLVNCGLLDEGLATLLDALSGPDANKTLKHLYLGTNGITARSGPRLEHFLARDCALESLYLSCNRLGDEGVAHLARGLAQNTSLRRVSVASNRIGPRGAAALSEALAHHPTLALFDLGFTKATVAVGELGNFIGDEGARAIARALAQNASLRVLDLLHNYISQVGVNHLREAMAVNRTLVSLQLTQFGRVHNEPGKEELRAALSRNRSLVPEAEREAVDKLELPDHITDIYSVYRTRT